jgi:type II secretory pathway component PulF
MNLGNFAGKWWWMIVLVVVVIILWWVKKGMGIKNFACRTCGGAKKSFRM